MNPLEKFSKKIGFTSTETNVILFLIIACLIGVAVNIVKDNRNRKEYLEFDYKNEERLFNAAAGEPGGADSSDPHEEKKIASQRELLDFTNGKMSDKIRANAHPTASKININSADAGELKRLPGIGAKTGRAILDYIAKNGKIKSLDELLNVKGIGRKKLEKIKSLIVLE